MPTALSAEACGPAENALLKFRVGIKEVVQVSCLRHGTALVVCSSIGFLIDRRDLEVTLCLKV